MPVRKRRIPAGTTAAPVDRQTEVVQVELVGSAFSIDVAIARLEAEGVAVVRSSPFNSDGRGHGLSTTGRHLLVFKAADVDAVGAALRDAGLV